MMPTTEPDRETKLTLIALRLGCSIIVVGTDLYIEFSNNRVAPFTTAQLGELESRGWIEHVEDRVLLTQSGNYWAERFAKQLFKGKR